jgi:hypothetical protein
MAVLLINVEDSLLAQLLELALKKGVGIEDHINSVLREPSKPSTEMSMEEALQKALNRVGGKAPGETFTVENLFSEHEWDDVPARRIFGRQFRREIESASSPIARYDGKTTTNRAIYKRC